MMTWMWAVVEKLLAWIKAQIEALGIDLSVYDVSSHFASLWAFMGLANTWLPFGQCFIILLTGWGARFLIRASRWILSCIPTSNQ